jgi:hypothetical protein
VQNNSAVLPSGTPPLIDITQTPTSERSAVIAALQTLLEGAKNPVTKAKSPPTENDATTPTPPVAALPIATLTPPVALASDTPVAENDTNLSIAISKEDTALKSQSEQPTQTDHHNTIDSKQPTKQSSLQEISAPRDTSVNAGKDSFNAHFLAAKNDNKADISSVVPSTDTTQQQVQPLQVATDIQNSKNTQPQGFAAKLPTNLAVVEQISLQMRKAVDDGVSRIRIKMQPASLGSIDIKMEVSHDGIVKAVLGIEKHETFEWMQKDFRHLERILQDTGLKTDSNSLSFHYRGGNGQGQQDGQQQPSFGNSNYNPEKETFLEAKISLLGDAPTIYAPKQGLDMKV